MRGGDRFARRQLAVLDERVDELAVLPQAVIEVRPGGGAGRADAPDQLSLIDVHAGMDPLAECREVQVVAFEPARVTDSHHVAAAAASRGRDDGPARPPPRPAPPAGAP